MTFPVQTSVISAQIVPAESQHGRQVLQVALDLRNSAGPIPEQVTLSVQLTTGDRTLSAIQEESVARAALVLADSTWSSHQGPSGTQGASAIEKLRFALAMWEKQLA